MKNIIRGEIMSSTMIKFLHVQKYKLKKSFSFSVLYREKRSIMMMTFLDKLYFKDHEGRY